MFPVWRDFWPVVKALVQNECMAAGQAILKRSLKGNVADELARVICQELDFMSSSESLATLAAGQLQSTAAIKFSWEGIYKEIAQSAPTLQYILSLALPEEKREKAKLLSV